MAIAADGLDGPVAPSRVITPRKSLPSGRAMLGALLITAASLGTFAIATSGNDDPGTEYLVLRAPIAAGESVALTDVGFEPMELSAALTAGALVSTDGLAGAVALRDLRLGELLVVDDLVASASVDGTSLGPIHELTFPIPLDRTPPGIRRGDRVTILGTSGETTTVAIEHAIVLTVDTEPTQLGSAGRGVITLAVDNPADVLKIAHITQTTEITVVRSTRALTDRYPQSVSSAAIDEPAS